MVASTSVPVQLVSWTCGTVTAVAIVVTVLLEGMVRPQETPVV